MFLPEIITRVYEIDRAASLTMMMTNTCIESIEGRIDAEDIPKIYENIYPFAEKIIKKLEEEEEKKNVSKIPEAKMQVQKSYSVMPAMRATPR